MFSTCTLIKLLNWFYRAHFRARVLIYWDGVAGCLRVPVVEDGEAQDPVGLPEGLG